MRDIHVCEIPLNLFKKINHIMSSGDIVQYVVGVRVGHLVEDVFYTITYLDHDFKNDSIIGYLINDGVIKIVNVPVSMILRELPR